MKRIVLTLIYCEKERKRIKIKMIEQNTIRDRVR
jgi:hypothetical protein